MRPIRPRRAPGSPETGFTLIEVMITVAVVAIATAIAMPSYSEYRRRADRSDAQLVLLQAATWLERRYAECNSYTLRNAATDPPCTTAMGDLPAELQQAPASGTARYTVTLELTGTQFWTLRATPVTTDAACGTLTLNSVGQRARSGSQPFEYCWRR